MDRRLAVIVSKCPRLKNVYKSNESRLQKSNNKGNKRGEVLSLHLTQDWVCVCVCIRNQTGDINNRGTIVPGCGGVPGLVFVYKTNKCNGVCVQGGGETPTSLLMNKIQ